MSLNVDPPPPWVHVLTILYFMLILGALVGMRVVFVIGVILLVIFLIRFAYAFHRVSSEDSQKKHSL